MQTTTVATIALGFTAAWLVACSGTAELPSDGAETTAESDEVLAHFADERFLELSAEPSHLAGVFQKGGRTLVFDLTTNSNGSTVRFSTPDGTELYLTKADATDLEMRVGRGYRSGMAVDALRNREASPEQFWSTGDLQAEFQYLARTPFALLPTLTAALGRRGIYGKTSPVAMQLNLLALHLTKQRVVELDETTRLATNRAVQRARRPAAQPTLDLGDVAKKSSALNACCPANGPTGCSTGCSREGLGDLSSDPCGDDCFGMCGNGCDVWETVCGDANVHAICWQHDSATCDNISSTIDKGICELKYAVYSAEVAIDTRIENCDLNEPVPYGLWTTHPDFCAQTGGFRNYETAAFDSGDNRYFTDTGDWSVNAFKAECAANEKLIGISASGGGASEARAHSALCVTSTDTFARTGFAFSTHNLDGFDDRADTSTGDWDPGYTKAECAGTEIVTGISQSSDLHLRKLECGWIVTETGSNVAACTTLVFSTSSDNQLSTEPGDWAVGYSKNQCRPNQYLKGVSANAGTGEIHAILCCDPTPWPH